MSSRPRFDPPAAGGALRDGWCVYWCALFVLGATYVVTVLCGRMPPLVQDQHPRGDWLAAVLAAPGLYLLSGRHTLRPPGGGAEKTLGWNALGFGLAFFAALHWEWVGRLTGANYSLTARQLSHLNVAGKIAFAVQVVLTLAIAGLCVREARRAGILRPYLLSFAGLVGALAAVTVALGPRYHFHLHHYFLALCLLPFVRFRHPVCFVTQAMLAGVFVEGICRWGADPLWLLAGN